MSFNLHQFLLDTLSGAAEKVEEAGVVEALQELHDKDEAAWALACTEGLGFANKLSSKSKFCMALKEGLTIAIEESQSNNGVQQDSSNPPNPPHP